MALLYLYIRLWTSGYHSGRALCHVAVDPLPFMFRTSELEFGVDELGIPPPTVFVSVCIILCTWNAQDGRVPRSLFNEEPITPRLKQYVDFCRAKSLTVTYKCECYFNSFFKNIYYQSEKNTICKLMWWLYKHAKIPCITMTWWGVYPTMSPQVPCKSEGQHHFCLLVFICCSSVTTVVDWDGLPSCCDVYWFVSTLRYHVLLWGGGYSPSDVTSGAL